MKSTIARHRLRTAALAGAALLAMAPASAQETVTYTYDAQGRLITVSHGATGPNAGVTSSYTYDDADNRTNVTVATGQPTITLSPATLPGGTVGTSYNKTISASGGTSPYTFQKSSGTLPAGLTLTSAGVLSGTPTTATTYSFAITATDAASNTGSQSYSVTIGTTTTLTLSPTTLPGGTVGTAYSKTITASGGTSPYTFAKSSGTLPTGLTLTTGGVLSGTPTTAGTYSFTVKATDSASHTGTQSYSVTIGSSGGTCVGVSFAASNNPTVNEGGALVFTITKGGTTSNSCSITYATANGTALAGTNYTAIPATPVTFTSGQTSTNVTVDTMDDGEPGNKIMYLNLTTNSGSGSATISDAQATGTIDNTDPICPLSSQSSTQSSTGASSSSPDDTVQPQQPIC